MNICKKSVSVIGIGLLSLVMIGKASPAAAADGVSVDAGYQYLHISAGGEGTSVPAGITAGVDIPLQSPWSVLGDFGWNRKSENGGHTTATSFGAGLRFTPATMSTFMPYVQAVAGLENDKNSFDVAGFSGSDSETNFMLQPGVGGTFALSSIKAFVEADFRWVNTSGEASKDVLFRVGIVIPVGR